MKEALYGGGGGKWGILEISVPPHQFCYKLKTALKDEVLNKKRALKRKKK